MPDNHDAFVIGAGIAGDHPGGFMRSVDDHLAAYLAALPGVTREAIS